MAGIFKPLLNSNIKTAKTYMSQLADVLNLDISGSSSARKYQHFVTAANIAVPGVTSSLYQTIYDQDFTYQTANPVLDMTVGLHSSSLAVTSYPYTIDANGKYYFPSNTLMMREKMDVYRLHAKALLGDAAGTFQAKVSDTNAIDITEAWFVDFKRLWSRDKIKPETFAIKILNKANASTTNNLETPGNPAYVSIYTDVSAGSTRNSTVGGEFTNIVDSATGNAVGLLFLDKGVAVLSLPDILDTTQTLNGSISDATTISGYSTFTGNLQEFLVSGSIDNVVDHLRVTRITGSATGETAVTFQSLTAINSSLFVTTAEPDEFNYSSNPTYVDSTTGRIVVIEPGQEAVQQSFAFITGIGFYDDVGNLLSVAKLSRPVLKDSEKQLTFVSRLDY